jgi:hypothetical protein
MSKKADGTTTGTQEKKTPEEIQKELADKQTALEKKEKELADKEAELEASKKSTKTAPAPDAEPTEEQWQDLEAQYGMPREEIKKNHKLIVSVVAPIAQENARLKAQLAVDKNVKTALKDLASSEPQFSKLEKFVNEYLEDVSEADKADPARLKKAMEKAVFYAKGKAPKADKKNEREVPEVDKHLEDDEQARHTRNKDEFYGVHEGDGKVIRAFKIKVDKKVPDDYREKHAHPDGEGGILVDERAEWDEAVAKRA